MSQSISPDDALNVEYTGQGRPLFNLAFKTAFLTLITLGVYRFWARTRLRKYFWSAVAPGGHSFEYDGRGLEKFLGFLIAVVVLAFYLGIIQVLLTFAGMSLFATVNPEGDPIQSILVTYITLLALAPLIYYAAYRAQRYKLSRTRWRGIRFAMEPAAWAYSLRGMMYMGLTIISAGLLMPLMTFRLEKFRADRTFYGQARLYQGGKWTALYPFMIHILIAVILFIVGGLLLTKVDATAFDSGEFSGSGGQFAVLGGAVMVLAYIWILVGFAYYRIHSFRYLTAHKLLGENIRAESYPLTSNVVGYYLAGAIVSSMVAGFVGVLIGAAFGGGGFMLFGEYGVIGGVAVGYIGAILAYGVIFLVMTTQPTIKHFAQTTTFYDTAELDDITQREGDDFLEAEGFADALDLGSAF